MTVRPSGPKNSVSAPLLLLTQLYPTLASVLMHYTYHLTSSSLVPQEVGPSMIPILQMRKIRLRGGGILPKGHSQ